MLQVGKLTTFCYGLTIHELVEVWLKKIFFLKVGCKLENTSLEVGNHW